MKWRLKKGESLMYLVRQGFSGRPRHVLGQIVLVGDLGRGSSLGVMVLGVS